MVFQIALSPKTIGIVGWLGKMGKWFVRYFSKRHKSLLVFDIRPNQFHSQSGLTICKSLDECVTLSDVVIICVPLMDTVSTIEKCALLMRKGASLIEISSIKYNTFRTLKKIRRHINLLCIHPMFGPGSIKRNTQKVLMIPVKNEERELSILNDLFLDLKIIVINDWKTHDRYMSVLLSLAYYVNILFAQCLTDQDMPSLKSLSGTSFAIQSLLSESMLTDEPSLIASLFTESPFVIDLIRKYNFQAATLAEYIKLRDNSKIKSLIENTKNALSKNIDFGTSYSKLYEVYGSLPTKGFGKHSRF
jgi:prephenate dehydrogenase